MLYVHLVENPGGARVTVDPPRASVESRSTAVELVLFDLGGVLIEVPGVEAMIDLTGIDSAEEVWRRWLSCRWVRRFESGGCSETDFAAGLIEDWALPISEGDFLESFGSWATRPIAGAADLVSETAAAVPVGCLSNTNALHWEHQLAQWPMMELFGHTFLSFQTGFVKPDRQAFDHVVSAAGIEADRILFLDDNLINVEAACQAGIRAVHTVGVENARLNLLEAGVLPTRHAGL